MQPLRFEPFLRPMVWGGRRLADKLGKALPDDKAYGESWEVSDHTSHHSIVAGGPLAGQTLRRLMEEHREDLLGKDRANDSVFPWLIKFLDAHDWLSVQVHPDEDAVKTLWPGEGSKTEAWFILDVQPGAKIFAGLKQGVDEPTLRQASLEGTVAEYLHSFEPKPGDCVYLPAGTVHAIGGGILLAEIQQTSDATFRLFDWNRKDAQGQSRTLHIDQGMAAIHWDQGPVQAISVPAFTKEVQANGRVPLVSSPYFRMEYIQSSEFLSLESDQLNAVIVLDGQGEMVMPEKGQTISTGEVWILPASLPSVFYHPKKPLRLLFCTLP